MKYGSENGRQGMAYGTENGHRSNNNFPHNYHVDSCFNSHANFAATEEHVHVLTLTEDEYNHVKISDTTITVKTLEMVLNAKQTWQVMCLLHLMFMSVGGLLIEVLQTTLHSLMIS